MTQKIAVVLHSEQRNCAAIGKVLERAGYRTVLFSTVPVALRYLRGCGEIDLLVSDQYLKKQEMTGVTLAWTAKAANPKIKNVLIVSRDLDDTTVEASQANGFRFLAEPFDLEALEQALK